MSGESPSSTQTRGITWTGTERGRGSLGYPSARASCLTEGAARPSWFLREGSLPDCRDYRLGDADRGVEPGQRNAGHSQSVWDAESSASWEVLIYRMIIKMRSRTHFSLLLRPVFSI